MKVENCGNFPEKYEIFQKIWEADNTSASLCMCVVFVDIEHSAARLHCYTDHEGRPVSAPTTYSAQGHRHKELRVRTTIIFIIIIISVMILSSLSSCCCCFVLSYALQR